MSTCTNHKLLLIGWDGADWKTINPLLDAGHMPNLEKLVNEGVAGNLATLYPSLSPMLWTSIATGKRPFKHGIHGFTEPDPHGGGIRPITTISRKTKAVWNILGQKGKMCNVIGWWPSHPAEPISGVMVSNHFQRAVAPIDKPWPVPPGAIHPPDLAPRIAHLRLHPQELGSEHIAPFVPHFDRVDQDKDHRLETLAKLICDCTSIHSAATAIMQLEPWDFMAIYYDTIDHFSHAFMRYHPPRLDWVPEQEFDLWKDVVTGGYRYHDMMLGALMALAGDDTTIMLVSDHGFHPDHLRPRHIPVEPAGPAVQHRHYGILVIRGPGIKQDERIYGANLLDVTPTILTALGLPVGEDMDGRPLVNAFEQPPAIETIPSWDEVEGRAGMHPPERQMDPVEAREAINQLVALGYIEQPNEDQAKAAAQTVRELNYNLARAYMSANRHADAATYLEELVREWPDEYRFGIHLVSCYEALDRIAEARLALEELFKRKAGNAAKARKELREFGEKHKDRKPEDLEEKELHELRRLRSEAGRNPYTMEYLMGSLLFAEGREEEALDHLKRAEKCDARQPGLYIKLGDVYLKAKRWEEAEASFRRAIQIDEDSAPAYTGLCCSLLGRRQNMMGAGAALKSVGLTYHNPRAHFLLGVALHRMGRLPRAVEALNVAVAQNPNYVAAHRRLAHIYAKRLKDPDSAAAHRRLADEARQRIKDIRSGRIKPARDRETEARALRTSDQASLPEAAPETGPIDLAASVVVVSGLPRSGTSMMLQMLQAGGVPVLTDEARQADEDNPRGYFEFRKARNLRRDRTWLAEAKAKAVKMVAQLLGALPPGKECRYRTIFMERNLAEVVKSQNKMLERQERQGARLSEESLRKAFSAQLQTARRILSVRRIPTLYVSYRETVEQPAQTAARVNRFLGGALNEAAMAAAVAPELYRQREE